MKRSPPATNRERKPSDVLRYGRSASLGSGVKAPGIYCVSFDVARGSMDAMSREIRSYARAVKRMSRSDARPFAR